MCGIAGFVDSKGRTDRHGLESIAARMAGALAHRGPDDHGVWTDSEAGVALGHRRLSILDLSPAGHQPMLSPAGRFVISYNGEIYNCEEIRQELLRANPSLGFRGHSDTEVMLAAFEQWGIEASLERMNGMFAFALWDREERTLLLMRDRLGEKPLYYGTAGTVFLFASELKALREHPAFDAEVDRDALLAQLPGQPAVAGGADLNPAAGGLIHQLASAGVGDQPSPADHDQVIGGQRHLAHQVTGDKHRPALPGQRAQQGPDSWLKSAAPGKIRRNRPRTREFALRPSKPRTCP